MREETYITYGNKPGFQEKSLVWQPKIEEETGFLAFNVFMPRPRYSPITGQIAGKAKVVFGKFFNPREGFIEFSWCDRLSIRRTMALH